MKHRKPNRLKGYDYSQDNLYFVTSCVHDMICCFGDVVVGTGRDLSSNMGRDLSSNMSRDLSSNMSRDLSSNMSRDLSPDAVHNLSSKTYDEPPSKGNDNIGAANTKTDNAGIGNTGTGNAGTGNKGTDNTGTGNAGTGNTGTDNTGTGNAGTDNTGTDNTGTGNTGTGHNLSLREPQMILNEYGKIAEQQWYWLAEQYPYVVLHEFIVMPNHIHGIIEINRNAVGTGCDLSANAKDVNVGTGCDLSGNVNDAAGTGYDLSLPKIKSLSELMGAYKTTVSKQIHLAGYAEFAWQRSFHDHIIRDEKSYERISNYIIDNPKTWDKDKFYNVGTGLTCP